MKNIIILFAISIFVFWGCDPAKSNAQSDQKNTEEVKVQPAKKSYDEIIGYMHQGCLAIKNGTLKKGDIINILTFNNNAMLQKTKVVSQLSKTDNCIILSGDRKEENLKEGFFFYQLDLSEKESLSPSFAIVGDQIIAKKQDKYTLADADSDNLFEYYTICNTSEGISFSVWLGEPWKSKEVWNAYYYLGYDMEPSCPDSN